MHMADALLSPAVAGTMYACTGAALAVSVYKVSKEEQTAKLPTMAVASALVFAGQMINYSIPGTGSSGHICGGMLLAALLGPHAGFLCMSVILAIQCFFFADGGVLALGANIWNMAFYGCFVGYFLLWKPIIQGKLFPKMKEKARARSKIWLAAILGCVITLQLGAFSVVLETSISGITELPFPVFVGLMQPIHLAIGLIEGAVTAAILTFIYEARPEMIRESAYLLSDGEKEGHKGRISIGVTVLILAITAAAIGGGFSLLASSDPDGLEWAVGKAVDEEEPEISLGDRDPGVYEAAESVQENTSFLPDYAFPDDDSAAGTTVSGLVGAGIVAAIIAAVAAIGMILKKRKKAGAESGTT